MKQADQKPLIYFGGIVLIYFLFGKPILNKLGITKSEIERKIDELNSSNPNLNPFSPLYRKQFTSGVIQLIKQAQVQKLVKQIYDSLGNFSGDDEAAVIDAFKQLRYKTQVSYLAEVFSKTYNKDLLQYLVNPAFYAYSGLSDDELKIIIDYVDKLPVR